MDRYLVLEDGTTFKGKGFGSDIETSGEVVFTTSMTGYAETLSDPSFRGQILVFASPTIGNYDWNEDMLESEKIQVSGIITRDGHAIYRSSEKEEQLDLLLKKYEIPGIDGLDTRTLIMKIREKGAMKGIICNDPGSVTVIPDSMSSDLLKELNVQRRKVKGSGDLKVLLIDTGAKKSMISLLSKVGDLDIIPYNEDFTNLKENYNLIFVSNGPGDPSHANNTPLISFLKSQIGKVPVAGICLGHQLIALACGASTIKMKYGHRGVNHSVTDGQRVLITTQNHGYAVDRKSLVNTGLEITLWDSNDGTIEGLQDRKRGIMSVQYHPEASPGPLDTLDFFSKVDEMASNFIANK